MTNEQTATTAPLCKSAGDCRMDVICFAIIALAVAIVGGPGIGSGGLGWSDAPNHVFDGIFLLEFFKQWPIDHVRQWAEQFYLRFPAIGIIVYYPPGFAAVEALLFAMLGVNILTARLTVLLFGVGAGWLMYVLGRRWFDRPSGLFAALLLITCPHGFLWLNDVMLEWPATFWILLSAYFYQRDRDEPKARWSLLFFASIVMAFMTKQTAGFILPVLMLHALFTADRRYWSRASLWVGLIANAAITGGYILITQKKFAALPAMLLQPAIDPIFYPKHLPEIVGWPLLPIVVLGLLTFICSPDRGVRAMLLLWFFTWAVFSSFIAAKEPRYFFFALPPLAFAATRFMIRRAPIGLREKAMPLSLKSPRILLLTLLVFVQTALGIISSTGRLPDYSGPVADLASWPEADVVLVDGVRDVQFVFDVYQNPAARDKIVPLRASKLLYSRAAREKFGYQQFVHNNSDIVNMLDRYGIRYVIIESDYPRTPYQDADPPPRKMLRELLSTDSRFALVKSWPLRCSDPIWDGIELRLYAYPTCPERKSDTIRLSIPAMNKEVELTLPGKH